MSSERWLKFKEKLPETIAFTDAAGKKRQFSLWGNEMDGGAYMLRAKEKVEHPNGYEFSGFSYSSPAEAISDLYENIRSGLSTVYLDKSEVGVNLLNQCAAGRVAGGGVVIDGKYIEWSDLTKMMQSYEGWEFTLNFKS